MSPTTGRGVKRRRGRRGVDSDSDDAPAVDLTPREYALLRALMARPGRTFTRDELLAHLYPDGDTVVITVSNPLPEVPTPGGQRHALRNIGDRLRLSFGAAGSLVTSSDDERYYAVLTLPYAETADR